MTSYLFFEAMKQALFLKHTLVFLNLNDSQKKRILKLVQDIAIGKVVEHDPDSVEMMKAVSAILRGHDHDSWDMFLNIDWSGKAVAFSGTDKELHSSPAMFLYLLGLIDRKCGLRAVSTAWGLLSKDWKLLLGTNADKQIGEIKEIISELHETQWNETVASLRKAYLEKPSAQHFTIFGKGLSLLLEPALKSGSREDFLWFLHMRNIYDAYSHYLPNGYAIQVHEMTLAELLCVLTREDSKRFVLNGLGDMMVHEDSMQMQ